MEAINTKPARKGGRVSRFQIRSGGDVSGSGGLGFRCAKSATEPARKGGWVGRVRVTQETTILKTHILDLMMFNKFTQN